MLLRGVEVQMMINLVRLYKLKFENQLKHISIPILGAKSESSNIYPSYLLQPQKKPATFANIIGIYLRDEGSHFNKAS